MARRVSNPPNPWAEGHVEWLGEPPAIQLEVYEEDVRSLITENDSPDVPFRHGVNPYRGCQHGCAYCYARRTHEFLGFGAGTDFESKIVVKRNAPARLRFELGRGKIGREGLAFSGATDCYQPLEASYRLTRRCLEVCRDFHCRVAIITKGNLVRRDLDVLAEIHERAGARVFLSIPFLDERHGRALEPLGPAPSARFETLRRLTAAGIPSGVAIAPVVPGLTEHSIPGILERAREAGADQAFMILLRLAQPVRAVFEGIMAERLPERAERVRAALEELNHGQPRARTGFGDRMRGFGPRWQVIERLFETQCRRLGFARREEGAPSEEVLEPGGGGPGAGGRAGHASGLLEGGGEGGGTRQGELF